MTREIAKLHIRALPHTASSRRGVEHVEWLYSVVAKLGYVKSIRREGKIVGVVSGIGRWILTLVVDPNWQRKGIGTELLSGLGGRRYVYTEVCTVPFYTKVGFIKIVKLGGIVFLWRK